MPDEKFTQIMNRVRSGDELARDEALKLVFSELQSLARRRLAVNNAASFEAMDLVNEAYARLLGRGAMDWQNRRHFFALAARAMRDILVERARARGARKRGGDWHRVSLTSAVLGAEQNSDGFLALDEAIQNLTEKHQTSGEVVQLVYYGGLTIADAAKALDVSPSSIDRLLKFGRGWLLNELEEPQSQRE